MGLQLPKSLLGCCCPCHYPWSHLRCSILHSSCTGCGEHSSGPLEWQYVYEETNRKEDGAVIAAFNNGYVGDNVFPPHGYQVAGTIATYNEVFCEQYPINNQDTSNGIPGIMYGR